MPILFDMGAHIKAWTFRTPAEDTPCSAMNALWASIAALFAFLDLWRRGYCADVATCSVPILNFETAACAAVSD